MIKPIGLRWVGYAAGMGKDRSVFKIYVDKKKRSIGRFRHRWEDSNWMEIGFNGRI